MSELFDFGFTAVDETELASYQQAEAKLEDAEEETLAVSEKIDNLYNAIQPLLNNLKSNPEKEYILWPNRLEKVEEFEKFLYDIYKS
jgi:peptidoglycan hydrolase CwlO-like protein